MAIQPIFIFSISRSGSTLVQRIVAAHQGVATVSEPWLLLPYLYTLRQRGVFAEYDHSLMVDAIEDFCKELPGKEEDYLNELRTFVTRLYEQAAGPEARYFLDKTPPYCLIAEEIMRLFPDGKFIFLWRHPMSTMASIIETCNAGRWHPTLFRGDLFIGIPRLISAYQADPARAFSVRFEDLLAGEQRWEAMMNYLDIDFDPSALTKFAEIALKGRMGDPTGVRQYTALSSEPIDKWQSTLANPLRRTWCRRYLRYLGRDRLAVMGYELDRLLDQLDSQPRSHTSLISDLGGLASDVVKEPIRFRLRRHEIGDHTNVMRELLRA